MSPAVERWLTEVVDVMQVPVAGDPAIAVRPVIKTESIPERSCDVLVIGGGTGGVAAALAAARAGCKVILIEETDWLGGQMTAQGVSALDEHEYIEYFGGTASYYRFREGVRDHYRARPIDSLDASTSNDSQVANDENPTRAGPGERTALNPGDCWVSKLAFEPRIAVLVVEQMLQPFVDSGRLEIRRRTKTVAAQTESDRIISIVAMSLEDLSLVRLRADTVIDASEIGDSLPLCEAEYFVGAETIAQTGEPQAQPFAVMPNCVQSLTYTFACERRPDGESHLIAKPARYDYFRQAQPYSLRIEVHGGEIYGESSGWLDYCLYVTLAGTKGGLWTYRRLLAKRVFGSALEHEITMFNWPGNDYRETSILDAPALKAAQALQDAKRVSLGFLYWLQTEAPTTADQRGAPELRLRTDIMGSSDGLSKHPYIRESRRIKARKTIVEQEVSAAHQPGVRAAHFSDSVGIGWYPIDIHRAGPDDTGASCRTKPFQIPLGALLPVRLQNLIAGGKCLGTTHITNGCYRLHPIEWNIGEAAGSLASFAIEHRVSPAEVHKNEKLLAEFQKHLLESGIPLAWLIDVPVDDPAFVACQLTYLSDPSAKSASLRFFETGTRA